MQKTIIFLFVMLLSSSCLIKKKDDDSSDGFSVEGVCRIHNVSLETMNCIELTDNSASDAQMSSACSDFQTDYTAEGAIGRNVFYSGILVGCSSTDRVGYCVLSDSIIHYYNNEWGVGAAQSDCTAKGGSFR